MSKDLRKFLTPKVIGRAVGNGERLVSMEKLGSLPHEMRGYRYAIPTFMHGKRITFVDKQTENNKRVRRAIFPNVIYRFMFSRLLDMNVYVRMTTTALAEMERKGGFDEYVLSIGTNSDRCGCDNARMYKRLIDEAFAKEGATVLERDREVAAKVYGSEYSELSAVSLVCSALRSLTAVRPTESSRTHTNASRN
ncbi:hypothetical protein BC830DRAFT_1063878 [Chytriomyces sp. MP71]|nr:hypothetical protein BC830DRAFT_1063878 [Chytriomyces sp. MP71]